MSDYDAVVLGGGAAGLMFALTAGQRGKRVLVLECTNKFGKKILMSGGGRCNFTNLEIQADHFLSQNPHFVKSAIARYTQWDFIDMVERHGIAYREKSHGQLFCDDSAKQIVRMLLKECDEAGVTCRLQVDVHGVEQLAEGYRVEWAGEMGGVSVTCANLIVATGGLSIPTLGGATGLGYRLAQQFDLPLVDRAASLVPLTLSGQLLEFSKALTGISLGLAVRTKQREFVLDLLFTHRGLSGPAILQISNYWALSDVLEIDLVPAMSDTALHDCLLARK